MELPERLALLVLVYGVFCFVDSHSKAIYDALRQAFIFIFCLLAAILLAMADILGETAETLADTEKRKNEEAE